MTMQLQGLALGTVPALTGPAAFVAVPAVEGDTRADAVAQLDDLGFRVIIRYVEAPGETEDTVFHQHPEQEAPSLRRSPVTLYVVRNPEPVPDWGPRFDAIEAAVNALEAQIRADAGAKAILQAISSLADRVDKALPKSAV